MTFQTFEMEAREFVAIAISDAETIAHEFQNIMGDPLISPYLPLVKAGLTTVLTAAGLPAAQIEAVASQVLSVLNRVSHHAAADASEQVLHDASAMLDHSTSTLTTRQAGAA